MAIKNFEFKAQVDALDEYEEKILTLHPEFKGLDHQIDTYFNVLHGRLKLREGNIENALINYDREDRAGTKESQVLLYNCEPDHILKEILVRQLGVKVVVSKKRKIFLLEDVKFHLDEVEGLGFFVEVEVIDRLGDEREEDLKERCDYYLNFLGIKGKELVSGSYSDLILAKSANN
ncbi:MAG: class IV adenylate cyclase [Chitinophagaceae bacterium]|nr:class IV adenylate cyclase [Chitinophagaceae bacterium]